MVRKALKYICFTLLVLMLGIPALAQNTKGDRPSPTPRESRFKTPKKSSKKSRPARQIRRQDDKPSQRAGAPPTRTRRGERAGKPLTPMFSKTKPGKTQKAWKGDITGRRIRPRSSSSRAWNVHPQPPQINYSSQNPDRARRANENPNVRRVRRMQRAGDDKPRVGKPIRPTFHKSRPQHRERAWRGDITGRPIRARSSQNVTRPPVLGGGTQMRPGQRPGGRNKGVVPPRVSGRARNSLFGGSGYASNRWRQRPGFRGSGGAMPVGGMYPRSQRRIKDGKIVPRSASASFLRNRSINTWAHLSKPKRKKLAADRDLAGHRLRGKNYETQRPILSNPTWNYQRRVAAGERPYKGPAAGGHISRSSSGRAWKGDVANRAIRGGKLRRGNDRAFLGFLKGGGYQSRTVPGEKRPGGFLRGRTPGMGAKGIANYRGNIKGGQRRGFSNQGEEYTGNIRTGKRGFSNQGEEYTGNIRRGKRGFSDQGEEYSGNIRSGRRGFNDQGEEYSGNIRRYGKRGFNDQGEEYTGNIRARRPEKGGGSRGGVWNNNGTPIQVRTPKGKSAAIAGYRGNLRERKGFQDQGEEYSGNIRGGGRPLKGGGSVSGKLWNNKGRALPGRDYSYARNISRYSGNLKAKRPDKGGGSVSGKLWNNNERALPGKDYSYAKNVTRYSGNIKAKRPEKGGGSISGILWNNNETPIAVRAPKNKDADYSGNLKRSRFHYTRNPNGHNEALRGEKASAATLKAGRSTRGVRQSWDYIRNPSSADEAQRTREPGKAFARSTDFHGNIKMKRFDLFRKSDLHPDARFVKTNKNNVPEEKDVFTNFKLWWARLFKKSETQPDHLKEKGGNPRYDKGEAGLWYE